MKWATYTMQELINEISMGPFGSDIKKSVYTNSGVPVLNGSNLQGFTLKENTFGYVSEEKADSLKKCNAHRGDIIVTHRGTLGQIVYIPNNSLFERYVISQSQFRFNLKPELARAEFIVYYFHTREGQHKILSNASQVGVPALARATTTFRQLEVKVPPLPVQDKIVGILSALDSKIENNNKINANLEAQAEALFKSWFVDFTPFKDQPFVDSELGSIPQGWKVGKLGDYCEVKSGYAFKSSWWTNKGYKIIKIKNISENGDINLNDCSCVLPENCDKAKNFIANTGDIVIAMTGATIGKFNIIPKIDEKFYINQRVGKFFLGEKPIEKVPYIYCFLKQENISTQIIQKGQGSAQPNISGADIESIPMLTPMSIILKYNKMCQPLFEKILSNRLESKKLSALRDTLLPKLMSGEIKL